MDPLCAIDSIFYAERGQAVVLNTGCRRKDIRAEKNDDNDDNHDEDGSNGDIDNPKEDDDDDNYKNLDDNDDSDFELGLSSLQVEKKPILQPNTDERVNKDLFLGLLKILVDETKVPEEEEELTSRNARIDYDELHGLAIAADDELNKPEAVWYETQIRLGLREEIA